MAVISAPYSSSPARGTTLFGFDWPLLLVVLVLSVWGCLTVVSATRPEERPALISRSVAGHAGDKTHVEKSHIPDAVKQSAFIVLGLVVMIGLAICNYQWLMHLQGWIYLLNLLMLGLVLVLPRSIAPSINGAKSWIVLGPLSLQMAEFSKFAVLVSLSAFVTRRQDKINELKTLLLSLLYLSPTLLLIMKQPDFGTAVAVLSIWFGVSFFGGARLRHLGSIALVAVLLFCGAWKGGILKPHQKERLASFLAPEEKGQKGAYQLKQSLIAIGGGQITGQGYLQGMQNRARYVPENQTDFIFTVVAEEMGFAGAASLILCYLFLLSRTAALAMTTENYFGVLLCGGFTSLLAFHCIENLGMTMRIMPITGVPLPFFSYGGSSYLAFSMCTGLLQSVVFHRRR